MVTFPVVIPGCALPRRLTDIYTKPRGLATTAAQAQSAAARTGKVSSPAEPVMEGVVVSAKRDRAATVSVVTNDKGRYSFPAARIDREGRAAGLDDLPWRYRVRLGADMGEDAIAGP
jgi:hypothetical protein